MLLSNGVARLFIAIILVSAQFKIEAGDEKQLPAAVPATGTVCIGRAELPTSGEKSMANPTGGNKIRSYSIQIDKGLRTRVKHDRDVLVDGIALRKKHWIVIRGDGKPVASFWFKFENYSSPALCLWFKPLYETWTLWDAKEAGHICKCG